MGSDAQRIDHKGHGLTIAAFSLIDWSKWGAGPTKHVVFWLSLLPISLTMVIGAFTSREGSHLAAAILFWYIFQAIAAYVVLMLISLHWHTPT